jgi:transcriptional regulator with XRE-family HTH domain
MLIADLHERIRQHVLAAVRSQQVTQTALAELVGMKQSHISNLLNGRRRLSIEGMDAILNVLGLDVTRLIPMSEQTRSSQDSSSPLDSVPMIQHRAAMNPTFGRNDILGELGFTKVLLRRLSADHTDARAPWVRFVAVRADTAFAAPMYPRFENGSVLLVDRHYYSLVEHRQGHANLYLIRKEDTLMVRWVEMQGTQLCLRPEGSEYPLDFISIDRKNPLTSCIVGRVAHIATELGAVVQRRPLLL